MIDAHIAPYEQASINNHEPRRPRKLLLHSSEIRKLYMDIRQKGVTIIPIKVYLKNGRAKIEIAVAKGKKNYDKRAAIAKRGVSSYGTVRVDELMITEDYSHVMHIVSNITGSLADGKDCFDALRAAFPGGTITGVPKVRCMEIIDELETLRRGPYTGSIGYIGFSGAMDFNIIIRTFVIKDKSAYVQVGAGIVADSDPEREYEETLNKAEALIEGNGNGSG